MVDNITSRILRGLASQGYGQFVQVIIRLAEVPLFFHFWGAQMYGEWLMLAAIPAYLTVADGGFATAASRDMCIRSGAGDRNSALAVFQSTSTLLLILSVTLMPALMLLAHIAPISEWFHFTHVSNSQAVAILSLLALQVFISFQGGLINGGFWCSGRYPLGMALSTTSQLIEFSCMAVFVALGGGPVAAASGYLVGRLIGTVISRMYLRRATPWLHYGLSHSSIEQIRRITKPAFASLAFPLGTALNIQGMTLIIGLLFGPIAVSTFSPIRTITRLVIRPVEAFKSIAAPELAIAYGKNDQPRFRGIFWILVTTSIGTTTFAAILLLIGGGHIMSIWTAGTLSPNRELLALLLVAAIFASAWTALITIFSSTNRHTELAIPFVLIQAIALLAASTITGPLFGLPGIAVTVAGADLIVTAYLLYRLNASDLLSISSRTSHQHSHP